MKEITDAFGYTLAGFSAGESCFLIVKQHKRNPRANYGCQFRIDLRDDDREYLEEIRETLQIGKIYNRPTYPGSFPNTKPAASFRVNIINECVQLVRLFEKYPIPSKKQRDFDIWKQAVAELQKPVNCRDPLLLDYYFHKIREVRKYEKQEELARPIIKEMQLIIKFE